MLSKKVEQVLVAQIEKELYSSNLYLAMASWAETSGYKGIAEWLYAQADEEHMHMLKFMKFVNERGGKAIIPAIQKPESDFKNPMDVFQKVLEHEIYVTESINNIVAVCVEEKDFSTQNWVQWFVTEQLEEEASVSEIIDKLKLAGEHSLYIFDRDIMSFRSTGSAPAN
jgi:ferritin